MSATINKLSAEIAPLGKYSFSKAALAVLGAFAITVTPPHADQILLRLRLNYFFQRG